MLTGGELMDLGYPKGKSLGRLLQGIRTATLDGLIRTKSEAIAFAGYYWREVLNHSEIVQIEDECSTPQAMIEDIHSTNERR